MAYGPPATGKTLSLQGALSLFGANNKKHHYNNCSKAFCLLRAAASTIPFGIGDFNSLSDLGEIIFLFFNGKLSANMVKGGSPLRSCPIYCSKFTFKDNTRYVVLFQFSILNVKKFITRISFVSTTGTETVKVIGNSY